MTFEKLEPIKPDDLHIGCLTCSTACLEAPLDMVIAVSFGGAHIEKDGKLMIDCERSYGEGKPVTVADAEKMAEADPDHDWRIVKIGPLHGETFQRHGENKWVCVESNEGFA